MKSSKVAPWQLKYSLLSASLKISLQKAPSIKKIEKILSLLCAPLNPIGAQHAALFSTKETTLEFTAAHNFQTFGKLAPSHINAYHLEAVSHKTQTTFFPQPTSQNSPRQPQQWDTPHYCAPLWNNEQRLGILVVFCKEKQGSNNTIAFIEDITRVLAAILGSIKDKENTTKEMEEIASAVAHEVRNPLAGIRGMAQSIEEEVEKTSDAHECSTRIIRQVDRLNKLLCDFFTHVQPQKSDITQIDIKTIVTETHALVEKKLCHGKILFHFNMHKDVPAIIAAPDQLQQVLLNLFLNSIDAIQKNGEISLTIEEVSTPQQQLYTHQFHGLVVEVGDILFRFADSGPGISQKNISHIFDPFFTTKREGTGLGLATVHRILKENRASIFTESSPEYGTIFYIFFKHA